MNVLKLKMPTAVVGRNVLDRQSMFILSPGNTKGWTWSPIGDPDSAQPISRANTFCNKWLRNLWAKHPKGRVYILEHILPLMFLGLRDVHMIAPKKVPPYLMPTEVWKQISSSVVETGEKMKWKTLLEPVEARYRGKRDGLDAFTRIEPLREENLIMDITISYPGLGKKRRVYNLAGMSRDSLLDIMSVGPQGWYKPIGQVERMLRRINWSHVERIVWPRFTFAENRERTLDQFLDHRMYDALGAMAILAKDGILPAAHFISVCSGHDGDHRAVNQAVMRDIIV